MSSRRRLAARSVSASAVALALAASLPVFGCESASDDGDLASSRSYKGHTSDQDAHRFVNAYPAALGTRLDDCQTCHRGGSFSYESKGTIKTTVIAPDGYLKDFSAEEVTRRYPNGPFYAGLETATLGTECGFVQYDIHLGI